MDAACKERVRQRASHRCEYRHLAENELQYVAFHVEHVVPKKHGGGDDVSNLALACQQCNLHKGANLSGIDPDSGKIVELFNPRADDWGKHFAIVAGEIVGLTPTGRATVVVFNMNTPDRVHLRSELAGE